MKKIELKELCDEVLITLNNLRDFEVEEGDGSVSVTFKTAPEKNEPSEEDTAPSGE